MAISSPNNEEWRPVVGHDGYEVSSLGRVRSWWTQGRWAKLATEPRVLRQQSNTKRGGYMGVFLGKGNHRKVHHLVLEAFTGPRPDGFEACHGNGDSTDNRAENLRWGTHDENHDDRALHGTLNRGERAGGAKLTTEIVLEIRSLAAQGVLQRDIATRYGIHFGTVSKIVKRDRWSHV